MIRGVTDARVFESVPRFRLNRNGTWLGQLLPNLGFELTGIALAYFGFVTLNKPTGISSRKAIDAVKKLVRPAKVGHTGTLDPLASGVLVVCLGPATRLASFVQDLPKTYIGEFRLGVQSASDDIESEVVELPAAAIVNREQLEAVLPEFRGDIAQVPPVFSAVKIQGQRAYKLARKGDKPKIEPRTVSIFLLELLSFDFPTFKLKIECGSGTYVRSLGRDIGKRLGSNAVMTSLIRTAVGQFQVKNAVDAEQLTAENLSLQIASPATLFDQSLHICLDPKQIELLRNGHVFSAEELKLKTRPDSLIAFDAGDNLLAILYPRKESDKGSYRPRLNFVHFYDR